MIPYQRGGSAFLDQVRTKRGNASLIESFHNTLKANRSQAVDYVNDDYLYFPSLYVLAGEIEQAGLSEQLSERCRIAIDFIRQEQPNLEGEAQSIHPSLKWMIQTGGQDNIDKPYLQKLDAAAVLLASVYRDRSMLPALVDMIFFRCRHQLPYHDLMWAFLETQDPQSLTLIADRLRSRDQKESACARRLLCFIPGIETKETAKGDAHFHAFCRWLEENGPYLRYKGETFDTFHRPTPYVVVLEAKYIGVFVSVYDGKPLAKLTKKERKWVRRFGDLTPESQRLLADYSVGKRRMNRDDWAQWMELPMKKQLRQAEGGGNCD